MTSEDTRSRRSRRVVEMGKAGTGKEPRITLRNYLDMSKSLNVEPSSSRDNAKQSNKNPGPPVTRDRRQCDMSTSMNADSGFFGAKPRSATNRVDFSRSMNSDTSLAANSPTEQLVSSKASTRSKTNVAPLRSPLSGSSSLASSHRPSNASSGFPANGLNGKMLPTSPNVRDSIQEQQLIEAFVDQLRSIASSSSSEQPARRPRVVRRALAFPDMSDVSKASRVAAVPPAAAAAAAVAAAGDSAERKAHNMDERKAHRSKLRNGEGVVGAAHRRRHHERLPVVEEKQTVISSPISYSAMSVSKTRLKSVDMAPALQAHAVECAFHLLENMDKLNAKLVAWRLKKEFDKLYGPAWHCIVGTSFGSYVTHSVGGFIYFAVGKVSILLFRTAIQVIDK